MHGHIDRQHENSKPTQNTNTVYEGNPTASRKHAYIISTPLNPTFIL